MYVKPTPKIFSPTVQRLIIIKPKFTFPKLNKNH